MTLLACGVLTPIWVKNTLEASRAAEMRDQRRAAAWAHYKARCETNSGEKINETISGVEGILLQRPREEPTDANLRDQYWMGDPYGFAMYPPVEIARYLQFLDENDIPTRKKTARVGYEYVVIPKGDKYLRYTLAGDNEALVPELLDMQPSRYVVSWEDISTKEDRSHWVAGSRLTVRDVVSGRLLGERTAYVFDSGLGSIRGARKPWLVARYANSCPPKRRSVADDRLFVEKVLKPAR